MGAVYVQNAKKDIKKSVIKLCNDLRWKSIIKANSSIFVKINLSLDSFYPGANTSAEFIKPLIEILSKRAKNVYVGDSNPSACNTDKTFKVTGLGRVILNSGGIPINLSKQELIKVKDKKCKYFTKGVMLPKIVIDSDAVISSACIKTHLFTTMSSSIKNMFGCLPGRKVLYHDRLDEAIIDAAYLTKPTLAITDGITAMQGNGPVEGTPLPLNLVIGSNDLVSHDSFIAKMMGFNPKKIKHINNSEKIGLGTINFQSDFDFSMINPFIPAKVDFISKIQDFCCKNEMLKTLCYKTPLYELLYRGAKKIKDLNRYFKIKNF